MSLIWTPPPRKVWTPSRKLQRGFVGLPGGIGGMKPSGGGGGDPHFANVSLLLHLNSGGTTWTDSSASPKTVTTFNGATTSAAQEKFGGASGFLDGVNDYATVPTSSALEFNTKVGTVEYWLRLPSAVANNFTGVLDKWVTNDGYMFFLGSATTSNLGKLVCNIGATQRVSASTIPLNQWVHCAASLDGTNGYFFIDGVLQGTSFSLASLNIVGSGHDLFISGDNVSTLRTTSFYIDDLRITKGVARYTANFTPPASQFPDS